MRRKEIVVATFALLHLLLVVVYITADWPERALRPALNIPLRVYQNLSGNFRDYAFFAPRVGSDLKTAFLLEPARGPASLVNFTADNREASFRYNCIALASMRDVPARDLFAQSWAALLLGGNPDAQRVTVMVKEYSLPSMADYRAGYRPRWESIYVGRFGRGNVRERR
jgi:hypothetical protein